MDPQTLKNLLKELATYDPASYDSFMKISNSNGKNEALQMIIGGSLIAKYPSILFWNSSLSFNVNNGGYVGTRSLGSSTIPATDFDITFQSTGSGQVTGVPALCVIITEMNAVSSITSYTSGFRIYLNHLGNINDVRWSDGSFTYNSTSTGKTISVSKRAKQVTFVIDSVTYTKDASSNFTSSLLYMHVFMIDGTGSSLSNNLTIIA